MTDDDEDDDDLLAHTETSGIEVTIDPMREITAVLDDLEALLKHGDVVSSLTERNVNASLALVAVAGLRAYLAGEKVVAAEDFETLAEEIRGRLAVTSGPPSSNGTDA